MELTKTFNCKGCGAPLPIKAGEVVITCEYCGSSANISSGLVFTLEHSIIPSNTDDRRIMEMIRTWMGDGPLKPSNLSSKADITDKALVFLPFYIVHTNVTSRYSGRFTRTGRDETRSGELSREYYWKVLGRRGSKFPTKEYEIPLSGKENFDLSRIPPYAKYLNAEMDEKDAEDMARVDIMDHQSFLVKEQVNEIIDIRHEFETEDIEFIHAPVWRVDYRYGDKDYQVLVDSSSGSVIRGDIPPPDQSVGGFLSDIKKALFGR